MDLVLGGGWPLGRMSNIVGDKSTGKTLLAIEACTNFARVYPKGRILYREAEGAFDKEYAQALGMPLDRIKFKDDIDTVEDFADDLKEQIEKAESSDVPGLYVLDSLDSLSDKAEMGRKKDEKSYGTEKAKALSVMFRKLTRQVKRSNVHLMIISQVRDNIGVTFGRKQRRSGGHAMDFYASQVLWLAHIQRIKKTRNKQERVIGIRINASCEKNKIGLAFRSCEFNIRFGYGIEDYQAGLEWLKEHNKLDAVGIKVKEYDDYLHDAPLWEAEEYAREKARLDAGLLKAWSEVETSFLPPKPKYV